MVDVWRDASADRSDGMSARPRSGFIYVAQESAQRASAFVTLRGPKAIPKARIVQPIGLVKVGFTGSPDQRFSDLARITRRTITVLAVVWGTSDRERLMHEALARFRADTEWGTEWFCPSAEVQSLVDGINAAQELRRFA